MERNTHILIATGLFPPEVGGPATYSKLLLDELPKRGFSVSVVPFRIVRKYPKIIRHIAYFFILLRHGTKADVVFAQDPVSVGLPALLAARLLKRRFLLKVVGDYAWEQFQNKNEKRKTKNEHERPLSLEAFQTKGSDPITALRKSIERYVAQRADAVIVPSEYLKRIVMLWGVGEKSIVVVYNGFRAPKRGASPDSHRVTIGASKEVLRGLLGFDGTLIVSAGRLVPWKGFDTLIEMMPRLSHRFPNVKLVIAGDGPLGARLKRLIEISGLERRVALTGALPKDVLLRYIQAADLFVLNTFYEGLSHQLLEVMALGTPIVTTNVGGNPEIITDKTEGFLVGYNDKKALERAITLALSDRDFSKRLAENAQKKVTEFNEERMLSELTNIFNSKIKF